MGEIVQLEGLLIPLDKIHVEETDIPLVEFPISDGTECRCEEIEFEVEATPELKNFFKEQSAIMDKQRRKVECFIEDMALAAVRQRYPEKSKEEQNALREFALFVIKVGWNACYGYHKEMIERY